MNARHEVWTNGSLQSSTTINEYNGIVISQKTGTQKTVTNMIFDEALGSVGIDYI